MNEMIKAPLPADVEDTPEARARAQRAVDLSRGHVVIDYTNWRGERSVRLVIPLSLKFGSNEWHRENQWMMLAHDVDKNTDRWFAMTGIHSWQQAA